MTDFRLFRWHSAPVKRLQLVGFPRSANTYLAQWCQSSRLPLVATHHHWDYALQAQLLAEGVTTYVLIREPAAVIASCMVWNCHHGSNLERELNNVDGHLELWRQFHDHALHRLLPRGARVVVFERILDRSVRCLLKADGFRLRRRWSKERYERGQRIHLGKKAADPATNLGSAFTGQQKPNVDVPADIRGTYAALHQQAEQCLADARERTLPALRKLARLVAGGVRYSAWTRIAARRSSMAGHEHHAA